MHNRSIVLVALCLITVLLARVLWFVPYVGLVLIVLALASFLAMGRELMRGSLGKRYRDPYDLRLLHDIHEREEMSGAQDIEVDPDADVVCPYCGHLYGSKFKVCPMCKR